MLYGNHKFGMQHFQVFGREVNATTYSLNAVACNYVGNLRQVNVAAYDFDASAYTNWILKLTKGPEMIMPRHARKNFGFHFLP